MTFFLEAQVRYGNDPMFTKRRELTPRTETFHVGRVFPDIEMKSSVFPCPVKLTIITPDSAILEMRFSFWESVFPSQRLMRSNPRFSPFFVEKLDFSKDETPRELGNEYDQGYIYINWRGKEVLNTEDKLKRLLHSVRLNDHYITDVSWSARIIHEPTPAKPPRSFFPFRSGIIFKG